MAVLDGDGAAVVAAVADVLPVDALQLVEDGLLAAVAGKVDGATGLAAACVDALRLRDWDGDSELADQLGVAAGLNPIRMLRPLPVDLEELAGILEGDPLSGGGRIDLRTGEVWSVPAIDYAREMGEEDEDESDDADRWVWVNCEGSGDGYRDMERFAGTVTAPILADRLDIALNGRGAFRRFKDVLAGSGGELERWYGFSDERQRGRARSWLARAGYTPSPLPARPLEH